MTRTTLRIAIVAFGWLALADSLASADHRALEPFLTNDVAAVAYLDLTAIDAKGAFEEFTKLSGMPDDVEQQVRKDAGEMLPRIDGFVKQLVARGARTVYVLLRPSDVAHMGPTYVLPLGDDAEPNRVISMLLTGDPEKTDATRGNNSEFFPNVGKVVDGAVVGAMNEGQLDQYVAARGNTQRADIAEALAAMGDADAGIVVVGDNDSRRVAREMFPALPAPFMEIDGRFLADGLKWGGVAVKLPPQPTVSLTIEAANADAAKTLDMAATKALELAKAAVLMQLQNPPSDFPFSPARLVEGISLLKPRVEGTTLSLTLGDDEVELAFVRDLLTPTVNAARASASRSARVNNFRQISLGMLNYESSKRSLPAPASYDADGRQLLSWRVHILPYVEQKALYDEFHLDEPWDSEHNRAQIARMPAIYADPEPAVRRAVGGEGRTTFVVPVGSETVFPGREGVKYRDIKDGASQTILVVEVVPERAVVWTKPDDWEVDFGDPLRGVKRSDRTVFTAAFCDGSVRMMSDDIDETLFKGLLTRAGGEAVNP
jgi:hypothetical protein